jgi:hypothetical protein
MRNAPRHAGLSFACPYLRICGAICPLAGFFVSPLGSDTLIPYNDSAGAAWLPLGMEGNVIPTKLTGTRLPKWSLHPRNALWNIDINKRGLA